MYFFSVTDEDVHRFGFVKQDGGIWPNLRIVGQHLKILYF
jgi:hypothetical protein